MDTATKQKRLNNKDALYALLRDGHVHHQRECMEVAGYRYGARAFELRREGHDIRTIRIGTDEFAYQMVIHPRQESLFG